LSRSISPLDGHWARVVDDNPATVAISANRQIRVQAEPMNDDHASDLEALKAEHRRLDEQIQLLSSESATDQLEIARLKKQKLRLKDWIQQLVDSSVPDIIA
jgi:hypothetical protein